MRKSSWIIPVLLLLAATGAPNAHADSTTDGTITFTVANGPDAAPTGSFVYDNMTNMFTSFTVNWDSFAYDFTAAANGFTDASAAGCSALPSGDAFLEDLVCAPYPAALGLGSLDPWTGAVNLPTLNGFSFLFADFAGTGVCNGCDGLVHPVLIGIDDGTYTVTLTTPTPEPGSYGLVLAGIGFLLVMRKRIGQGLPRAS